MSKLSETIVVACPYHLAKQYLADVLRTSREKPDAMTVGIPFGGLDVSKQVEFTTSEGADPMHFDQPWKLHWSPAGGGPYPDFDGELTVRADEDYTSCLLELQGAYRPPGGLAGEAFDTVAGRKIASATARALLEKVGAELVERYWSVQAARNA